MARKTKNKNVQDDQQIVTTEDVISQATSIESFMLPPEFRKRSSWTQRFKLISLVVLNAFVLGLGIYFLISGMKEKVGIVTKVESTYFIFTVIMPLVMMGSSLFYLIWIKSQSYTFTWSEYVVFLVPPILVAAGYIFIQFQPLSKININSFMRMVFYLTAATGGATIVLGTLQTLIKNKTYRESKYRSFFLTPGMLISSASGFLMYWLTKDSDYMKTKISDFLISGGALFGGILVMLIGVAFSSKYVVPTSKNIWHHIRYTSGLPLIIVLSTIIGMTTRLAFEAKMNVIIGIEIGVQLVLLLSLAIYSWFRARIKNMHKTNPLYNEIVLKVYGLLNFILIFVFIYTFPVYVQVKSFAVIAFALAFIGSIIMMAGIIMANFMNLITYIKYRQLTLLGVVATTLLIVGLTLSIASLRDAEIITEIIGRQLMITTFILAIILQSLSVFSNLVYVLASSLLKRKIVINKNIAGQDVSENIQEAKGVS